MKVNFNPVSEHHIQRLQTHKNESFNQVFQEKLLELKFSKHSLLRMEARNVKLTDEEYKRLLEAVEKADSKGIRDSLIIMDNKAFVVNLKSKTVITALDKNMLKNSVFTNIDGAVII